MDARPLSFGVIAHNHFLRGRIAKDVERVVFDMDGALAVSYHFLTNLFETVQAILEIDRVIDQAVIDVGCFGVRAVYPRLELQLVVSLRRAYIVRCVNDACFSDFKYGSTRARGDL